MAPRSPGTPGPIRGSTLIEQIMVISIIAVLACVALPSLGDMMRSSRLRTAQTDFIAALRHAREAAVTSGKRTLFCPSEDGSHCSGTTRWDRGWLLGHDTDRNDQPDNGPLYTGPGYHDQVTIRSSSGRHLVRFYPDGSASGSNLTLLFCQPDGKDVLGVVVSNSGRIRGTRASDEQAASCQHAH